MKNFLKRLAVIAFVALGFSFSASAQKFALVDMEYILGNLPDYEVANNQLEQLSQRYQKEVEQLAREEIGRAHV